MKRYGIHALAIIGMVLIGSCGPFNFNIDRTVTTHFEDSDSTSSPGYEEGMEWWRKLDTAYRRVSIIEFGLTDAGIPLHLVILSNKPMNKNDLRFRTKPLLLINNAIHAGEPDGVDASMLLFRDILQQDSLRYLFKDVIIACIPYYSIGGVLNRNSHTRANQDGPEVYGFRGNAQNLDLNRDFIKMDSRNARSFAGIIESCDPDLYIETHVSNGADYPYVMTYLSTLPARQDSVMKYTLEKVCTPYLEHYYKEVSGQLISPYVNVHGAPPDHGFAAFNDEPRYSTGYLSTIGIPGYITETHMLKPFKDRVVATYRFLLGAVSLMNSKGKELMDRKMRSRIEIGHSTRFGFNYTVDSSYADTLLFHGYAHGYKPSAVTGEMRLYYNRDSLYVKKVPYYTAYKPELIIEKPSAYLLKRGYSEVEKRLKAFGIPLQELERDTVIPVTVYHIADYQTAATPYERHYFHSRTKVEASEEYVQFRKGDYLIETGSWYDRLVMVILEPQSSDSYFNWNFYDAILQQKEWFSSYVFEDKAYAYLMNDSTLRKEFAIMSAELDGSNPRDKAFRQLYWVYTHSPHYEKEHLRYPVFRLE